MGVDDFERRGLKIWDTERILLTNDHFSPPATPERADISNKFMRFARAKKIRHLMIDRGICHQVLVEHRLCQPGSLIIGADSHTVMAGAVGACATGMGSTDVLFALATGTTWLRQPSSIRVILEGRLPTSCSGRDIVMELLRLLGESGAQYRSLEFADASETRLHQDDRFAIANMAIELGAKFGIFVPDEITADYCFSRDSAVPANFVRPDANAVYERTIRVDMTQLTPRVAKPWSPANVVGIDELSETPVSVAFLGSCSSARLTDIRDAASEIRGKKINPNVRFICYSRVGSGFSSSNGSWIHTRSGASGSRHRSLELRSLWRYR